MRREELIVGNTYLNALDIEVLYTGKYREVHYSPKYQFRNSFGTLYAIDLDFVLKHYKAVSTTKIPIVGEFWLAKIKQSVKDDPVKILDIEGNFVYYRFNIKCYRLSLETFLDIYKYEEPRDTPEEIYVNVYDTCISAHKTKEAASTYASESIKETAVKYIRADLIEEEGKETK